MQPLVDRLLAFLAQDGCTDAEFDGLAAALFELQYLSNEPYRRFCQRRSATPRRVSGWRQVPPVPISAFKDATLSCVPPKDCERVFMTSGTSRGEVKGHNHHPTLAVWDRSMQRHFEQRFMQGSGPMPMLLLFPDEVQLPNSSLARYLSLAARCHGTPDSRSYIGPQGLDVGGLRAALDKAVAQAQPVALMGASFSVVHLLDALHEQGLRYALPAGSRILDTGGYKGQAREQPLDAFYDALAENESAIQMLGDDKLKLIAHELLVSLRENVSVDWAHRESARARMRVLVKRILRKYGYPPDLQDAAVQTVLQQAEALSSTWSMPRPGEGRK